MIKEFYQPAYCTIFRLMLGFMSTAMFLSMWVSNTATTAMMVPIIDAVMRELNAGRKEDGENSENGNYFCNYYSSLNCTKSVLRDLSIYIKSIIYH